ncbi:Receptor expression-enhancing protein 1 [Savitreella phatthalungensis]
MFGPVTSAVTSVVGYGFPIYGTYKALSASHSAEGMDGCRWWLMYWSVVGGLSVCEWWVGWAVSWVPVYREVKLALIVWLLLPQTAGAVYLYTHHLQPFLAHHEQHLDTALAKATHTISTAGGQLVQKTLAAIGDLVFGQRERHFRQTVAVSRDPRSSYVGGILARLTPGGGVGGAGVLGDWLATYTRRVGGGEEAEEVPPHLEGEARRRYVGERRARLLAALASLDADDGVGTPMTAASARSSRGTSPRKFPGRTNNAVRSVSTPVGLSSLLHTDTDADGDAVVTGAGTANEPFEVIHETEGSRSVSPGKRPVRRSLGSNVRLPPDGAGGEADGMGDLRKKGRASSSGWFWRPSTSQST